MIEVKPFTLDLRLTLDGVMTLAAGIVAFFAVRRQIQASREQVELQLRADREARAEDERRQRIAVAKAVLFEIDGFYRYYLRDPRDVFADIDPGTCELLGAKPVSPDPFPVYRANAAWVGRLEDEYVQAIVEFYGAAESYLCTVRDYREHYGRTLTGVSVPEAELAARTILGQMKASIPEVIKLTYVVSHKLTTLTAVPFEWPTIAVAQEKVSLVGIIEVGTKRSHAETH